MTKLNEIGIRLIKVSGSNIISGKGILQLDRQIIIEKTGFLFRKIERYIIDSRHVKRDKKGKAFIGIDLKSHRSFDLAQKEKMNAELLNTLDFLVDKAYHKAHMDIPKISRWEKIAYMFAGMGLFFLITKILEVIFG